MEAPFEDWLTEQFITRAKRPGRGHMVPKNSAELGVVWVVCIIMRQPVIQRWIDFLGAVLWCLDQPLKPGQGPTDGAFSPLCHFEALIIQRVTRIIADVVEPETVEAQEGYTEKSTEDGRGVKGVSGQPV